MTVMTLSNTQARKLIFHDLNPRDPPPLNLIRHYLAVKLILFICFKCHKSLLRE